MKCNAVFEGGGIRGIGHVGAAYYFEKSGFDFVNLAGSSAGAIVASLLAVGYTCTEIKEVMESLEYVKFKRKNWLDYFGTPGKLLSIWFDFGVYNADYFEDWLNKLLKKKGKFSFGDIKTDKKAFGINSYKLQVTASDLTDNKLLVFPMDFSNFGIDPDSFSIAKAVRMSMSIPIFYEPFRLKDKQGREHLIVDGGLLSNYPIWILDDGISNPQYPTFGFKFVVKPMDLPIDIQLQQKLNAIDYIKTIVATALDANDNQYISYSKGDFQRTITIPTNVTMNGKTKNIRTTDFDIDKIESAALFNNGKESAERFLDTWNFEKWKNTYRSSL